MNNLETFDTLKVKEIRELGRTGKHPYGWFLVETDTLAYWMHLPHKDFSNENENDHLRDQCTQCGAGPGYYCMHKK